MDQFKSAMRYFKRRQVEVQFAEPSEDDPYWTCIIWAPTWARPFQIPEFAEKGYSKENAAIKAMEKLSAYRFTRKRSTLFR